MQEGSTDILLLFLPIAASEMTYIVSGGALNYTHSPAVSRVTQSN